MQYLETVSRSPAASWYRVRGEHEGPVSRWVVTTPQTSQICNEPEVCGVDFSRKMSSGMSAALSSAPFIPFLKTIPSNRLCVMNFLRGSLNFDLRGAIAEALDSNLHSTCFMSSQRYRRDDRWFVKEDMYRKLRVPDGAVLFFGDVVATGVTVDNGMKVILEHILASQSSIKALVFFTIGCHKMEKVMDKYDQIFREHFPDYQETHLVYLETKARLVNSTSELSIGIPGTDLIKADALLAPEFELSQYKALGPPLERCVIYDAGSRAFDVAEYLDDVVEYWQEMAELAQNGFTLEQALKERWPEQEYGSREELGAAKRQQWVGISDEFIDELWAAYQARWTVDFRQAAGGADALAQVASERLAILNGILDNPGDER
mgnify:CR=1 FL=1